jgi:two-component system sensor histidine kinase AlgZ
MHPFLTSIRRLGFYLLAWLPLAALLVALLFVPGHLEWHDAVRLCVPLCLVYAFICLSAWYACRVLPVREGGLRRLLITHVMDALIGAGVWVLLARMLAGALHIPAEQMKTVTPLLFGTGVLLYLLSVAFHYAWMAIDASREAQRRETEARVLAGDAELRALKAQINPHFLYNSLNSISALTSIDPARARQMCIQLSEFLRSTLGMGEKRKILLREELELVHRYLAIEKVRFGARLTVEEAVDADCTEDLVPALVLQPLVENAVVHGIANVVENGVLRLRASHTGDGRLAIQVENSYDPEAPQARRGGFGLANVRKRLQALYGSRASLQAGAAGEQFRVEISLPRGDVEAS